LMNISCTHHDQWWLKFHPFCPKLELKNLAGCGKTTARLRVQSKVPRFS
jgi:hypothetical protein